MQAPTVHLHSSPVTTRSDGWSFGPSLATAWLWCNADGRSTWADRTGVRQTWTDPLEALRWMQQFPLGRPTGSRWIGFLSYDFGRHFEDLPSTAHADLRLPLFAFSFHPAEQPLLHVHSVPIPPAPAPLQLTSTFTRCRYLASATRVLDYIHAGDIFQANLSQRFTLAQREQAQFTWQRALQNGPSAYGAWLQFGDLNLVSLSPELFLSVDGRSVTTRPIKGTRPNLPGQSLELRDSTKDAAELNMIIDLERNDLGRICEIGTVRVERPRSIESHPTVLHAAATVSGMLRPEIDFVSLLRATFPGGSVTGAPKIRAMQIIEELEPVRRHAYCGAIGYLAADGSMQFNVAIRTMTMYAGQVHLPVGGGVVADSDPSAEYAETLTKAAAMVAALGISPDDWHAALVPLLG